jgi:hypothetical protein
MAQMYEHKVNELLVLRIESELHGSSLRRLRSNCRSFLLFIDALPTAS